MERIEEIVNSEDDIIGIHDSELYVDRPGKEPKQIVTADMWAISICDLDDLKLYKDLDGDKVLDDNERVASNLWPRLEYQKTK